MTPTTIHRRRAWRCYFEALARSERALQRAERALGAVALAASRFSGDPDAVALRHESMLAAVAVGRLRRRLAAVGTGPEGGLAMNRPSDLVHVYTRSAALADGVLVDVTRQASPAEILGGFTVPVAVTAALWTAIEAIPTSLQGIADVRGRLHDVLWMAACAARRVGRSAPGGTRPQNTHNPHNSGSPCGSAGSTGCAGSSPDVNAWVLRTSARFHIALPRAGVRARLVMLRLHIGPGDKGEPVATIGLPEDF